MLLLGPTELAGNLHEINSRLRVLLNSLAPEPNHPITPRHAATPQQMTGLLSELMRAGQWLRALPTDQGPALEQELGEYRKNVEHLHAVLPSIHNTLLRERARLEQERARVASAAAWAGASRQTL
jgi:hypothetical protein